jgi:hypothetical protein
MYVEPGFGCRAYYGKRVVENAPRADLPKAHIGQVFKMMGDGSCSFFMS